MKPFEVIKDLNAGNSCNTYWKGMGDRAYCIRSADGKDFLRDAKGRVRRFGSKWAAVKAARKAAPIGAEVAP